MMPELEASAWAVSAVICPASAPDHRPTRQPDSLVAQRRREALELGAADTQKDLLGVLLQVRQSCSCARRSLSSFQRLVWLSGCLALVSVSHCYSSQNVTMHCC